MVEQQQPAPARALPRLAVLLDSWQQPSWIRHALQQILVHRLAEITAVVLNTSGSRAAPSLPHRARSWIRNAAYLPYELYRRFDRRFYRYDPAAFAVSSVEDLLSGAEVLPVTPRQSAFSDYFSDADIERLLALKLDVALRFGFRILRGRALHIASNGLWSFHHGDNTESRGGPACFWEVFEGREATGAVLQVLSEDLDAGHLLSRVQVPTHTLSVNQTASRLYWRAVPALLSALERLGSGRAPVAQPNLARGEWQAYSRRLYTRPRTGAMMQLAGRLVARRTRASWQAMGGPEQWRLMLHVDRGSASDVPNAAPFRFRHLVPPTDRFWADPCPVWHEGRHWLFFEERPLASANAHISVVELNARGEPVGEPIVALRRDYHLSYPFLFYWDGTWYMSPESYARGAIELFRCRRFPESWEFSGTLVADVAAVDPTIIHIGGRWWLFAALLSGTDAPADMLNLYFADAPVGPWTPHALNPVKVDLRSVRPAGRPFQVGGTWYRPAQDGAPKYGTRIVFNRIDEISPTVYRETVVDQLEPSWDRYVLGTHTINCAHGLTVIDARYRTNARGIGRR